MAKPIKGREYYWKDKHVPDATIYKVVDFNEETVHITWKTDRGQVRELFNYGRGAFEENMELRILEMENE